MMHRDRDPLAALLPPLDARNGPAERVTAARAAALSDAIVARALGSERPGRRRGWIWPIGVAAIVVTGGAAALTLPDLVRRPRPAAPAATPMAAVAGAGVPERARGERYATPATTPDPTASALVVEQAGRPPSPRAAPTAQSAAAAPEPPRSAEDLLERANRLRGAGRWQEAERTYSEVLRVHPGSPASYVATLAAASLRLDHLGDPAGALRLYRAAGATGALTAEALFGAARCHRALGDAASEAASLRQLVASNPGSLHRRRAEERLRELSARPSNHPGSSPEEEP